MPAKGQGTTLLIGADSETIQALRSVLAERGGEVLAVSDETEALSVLEGRRQDPRPSAGDTEADRRFRELLDFAPIGLAYHRMIYDAAGKPIDYLVLEANKTYKDFTGVDPVGRLVTEAFPGIERDPFDWIGVFGKVVETGQAAHFQQHLAFNDRYYDCAAFRTSPGCFAVAFTEITERERAKASLEAERSLLRSVMEASPVGIATVDAGGGISYANRRAEEILGLSKDDITSRSYNAPAWRATRLDGSPFPDEEQPFMVVKRTLAPAYGIRHAIEWPDGRRIMLSVNGRPLFDAKGQFQGVIATFEDITELRASEERIETMLEEKELILKEAHHRIKNNMNVVASLLDLEAGSLDDSPCSEVLEEASERMRAMMGLYDKLYRPDLSGQTDLHEALPPLLDEIISLVSPRVRLRLSLEIEPIPLLPKAVVNLGIILNELIANSSKYAFPDRDEGTITVKASGRGEELFLSYRDDGVGLPEEVDFETSSGFGMRLIGILVSDLRGRSRIERGGGASFSFSFPLKEMRA